jgi:hypothetical protein
VDPDIGAAVARGLGVAQALVPAGIDCNDEGRLRGARPAF